ncbi:MAG: hypothetical protein KF744_16795 [Taibaiella sp.]|nr:hypothetical protein [Taibaiella sp.]
MTDTEMKYHLATIIGNQHAMMKFLATVHSDGTKEKIDELFGELVDAGAYFGDNVRRHIIKPEYGQ